MLTYINLFLLTSHQTIEELLFSCWEPSVHPQGSTIKNLIKNNFIEKANLPTDGLVWFLII